MLKFLTAAALVVALATPAGAVQIDPVNAFPVNRPQAQPHGPVNRPIDRWHGPCQGWRYGETLNSPAKFNANPRARIRIMALIVCVFDRWAPGNSATALAVAERESHYLPWAVNVGGCGGSGCLGIFQHMASAWDDRARAYIWEPWFPRGVKWSDPRAAAIVSARMVAAGGWGPWGG